MSLVVDVLSGAVRGGTSIMYAGLGETVSERAGVINLGTEGCMLMGALSGFAVAYQTGSPWLGVLAAAIAGGLLATMGYTAFLASWLAKHKPIPVLFSSMLFAALIVAGDSLQIDSGLPAASINILTGLILIAVLGWTTVKSKKGA